MAWGRITGSVQMANSVEIAIRNGKRHSGIASQKLGTMKQMSGRKQHFIPQSLLKGFANNGSGKKLQVVVYPFGGNPFVAATDGIGAKRNFYSELDVEGEMETLDDEITKHESPLAEVLRELRSKDVRSDIDSVQASALVTHLVVRNDHFRKIAVSAVSTMFASFEDTISDQDTAARMFGLDGETPGKMFSDSLQELWDEHGAELRAAGLTQETFEDFAFQTTKSSFSELHSQMLAPMRTAFSDISEKASHIAADAQIRALEQDLTPEKWIEKLSRYRWHVQDIGQGCILPDCVAICIDSKGDSYPLIFSEDDPRQFVVMPLATNRVLVGAAKDDDRFPANLNFSLARCSWDFFVADSEGNQLDELSKEMRVHMQTYIDETVVQIVSDTSQGNVTADVPDTA
jgi:Protein of unknown function (DUF4238)